MIIWEKCRLKACTGTMLMKSQTQRTCAEVMDQSASEKYFSGTNKKRRTWGTQRRTCWVGLWFNVNPIIRGSHLGPSLWWPCTELIHSNTNKYYTVALLQMRQSLCLISFGSKTESMRPVCVEEKVTKSLRRREYVYGCVISGVVDLDTNPEEAEMLLLTQLNRSLCRDFFFYFKQVFTWERGSRLRRFQKVCPLSAARVCDKYGQVML